MDEKNVTEVSRNTPSPIPAIENTEKRGKPWMYKTFKLGPVTIPAYATPQFQIVFVAMVCFLCPGMFNAVNGLGAAGQVSATDINNANTALNATFSAVGFFCGSICNRLGLRLTLGLGGFGYFFYVASILSYNHNQNAGFLIFAGALLGVCAGMLWSAQGAVMMSYPSEREKGRYISRFWAIFNFGGVIGALIPLGQNMHSTAGKVNDGTYIAFMILMAAGFVLACFLCDPKLVRRDDGTGIILMKNPSWKSEILGLLEVLKTDFYIIGLFPLFFASNWFYTYHFQDVNLPYFNLRTRSLNNVLYWGMQIIGAFLVGYLLDIGKLSRPMRAKCALAGLLILTMAIWGGGYAFQKQYTRESTLLDEDHVGYDFKDSKYIAGMFMYMFYGFYDAAWQVTAYWLMASLTNNSRKLACFAGFYKGIQSAGAAIASNIDARQVPFMTQFAINWGMLAGSVLIAAPIVIKYVRNTVPIEEDLKFSDETIADVVPENMVAEAMAKFTDLPTEVIRITLKDLLDRDNEWTQDSQLPGPTALADLMRTTKRMHEIGEGVLSDNWADSWDEDLPAKPYSWQDLLRKIDGEGLSLVSKLDMQ
ncbi:hypothetical protein OHC33_001597 [Knufia fluminis]|uniref:MFS general substrate transporter n=1 Tax=Knufia fluminis TaxID=191047 RepID=A0AAN8EZI5_9EURO|nr:hypothetical protein OHC33_001597 [Knufia fluminis]